MPTSFEPFLDAALAWRAGAPPRCGDARPQPEEAILQEATCDALRAAEVAGFARAWIDAPPGSASPVDALRLAIAGALATRQIRVVACVPEPVSWLRFAEDVATADGLCAGRLEVALPVAPAPERVAWLRAAWSGDVVTAGAAQEPVQVHPRPASAGGPPLWAGVADRASARAAADADVGALVRSVELLHAYAAAHAAGSGEARCAVRLDRGAAAEAADAGGVLASSRRAGSGRLAVVVPVAWESAAAAPERAALRGGLGELAALARRARR